MTVYILREGYYSTFWGAYSTEELAYQAAKENDLRDYSITKVELDGKAGIY